MAEDTNKAPSMDKGEIRQLAKDILEREPRRSAATLAQYEKDYRRMHSAGYDHWLAYAENRGLSKRSAYKYKAAWQYKTAQELMMALKQLDGLERQGGGEKAREARRSMAYLATLLRDQGDYEHEHRHREEHAALYEAPAKPKASKHQSLKGLEDDWIDRMQDAASTEGDRLAIWAMAVTGCRPAELFHGVEIATLNDGSVKVVIKGVKTGQGYGQPKRTFILGGDSVHHILADMKAFGRGHLHITLPGLEEGTTSLEEPAAYKAIDRFRNRVKRAAKRAGLPDVSAYTFRHAFAARLKGSGTDTSSIAGAMGHCVDATQSQYGNWARSGRSGGLTVSEVETTRPIKQTAVVPPPLRPEPSDPAPHLGW